MVKRSAPEPPLGSCWRAPQTGTLPACPFPTRLTFLGTGLLGTEAGLCRQRLEVEQLGDSALEVGADWLPTPFLPIRPGERYFSLILKLVLPCTAGEKVTGD